MKQIRLTNGLSQQALADAVNSLKGGKKLSRTSIVQWETNTVKEIESANLLLVAKVLGVSPEWLRFGTDEMTNDLKHLDGISLHIIKDFIK